MLADPRCEEHTTRSSVHMTIFWNMEIWKIKKVKCVFFSYVCQANLCQGGRGARGPHKSVVMVNLYLMHHHLELQSHIIHQLLYLNKIRACVRAPCGLFCSGRILLLSILQLEGLSRGDQSVCWHEGNKIGLSQQLIALFKGLQPFVRRSRIFFGS